VDLKTVVETVIKRLEDAWNAADGEAFGAPFAPDADFVNIRGDLHSGSEEIAAGHQQIFDSIYAGSTVRYTVLQARGLDRVLVDGEGGVEGSFHLFLAAAPANDLFGQAR